MLGKDAKNYGMGLGIFAYLDFPLAAGNNSLVIELAEMAYFPEKDRGGFFSAPAGKAYASFKAGYRKYFSETSTGFYLQPSLGCAFVSLVLEDESEINDAFGFSGALEGGYSIGLGEDARQKINLGLKYEYSRAKETHQIQTIGLRISYSFGLFGRKEY
jgi:hypothetical protein